jgi:hypothetical protein
MREILSSIPHFVKERVHFQRLAALRREVHKGMKAEITERVRNNPVFTETEDSLGVFVELLEPQVRDAVLELNRKGYTTYSSGFFGKRHEVQAIAGVFALDDEIKKELAPHDVEIEDKQWFRGRFTHTIIAFKPQEPDLAKIKQRWDLIAAILPDRGQLALPNFLNTAVELRKIYAPHSPYLEEWQARVMHDNPPEPKTNPKDPVCILVAAILTTILGNASTTSFFSLKPA